LKLEHHLLEKTLAKLHSSDTGLFTLSCDATRDTSGQCRSSPTLAPP